jgi:predicted TIM-barrel fold metal-dependent hydrolase
LLRDTFIADAVVHGYNWTKENWAIPNARLATEGGYGAHAGWFSPDPAARLTEQEFKGNWQVDDIAEALFLEGGADIVSYHGTPIWDFFKDGHSDTDKGAEWKLREPDRVIYYGAANPLDGKKALEQLERIKDQGADAVKVYSAFYRDGKTIPASLDDPEFGFPFIEKALDLGFKIIGTHKAIPFGPVHSNAFDLADIPGAAVRYPEMTFEILHAGFAFLEETAFVLGAFPENTVINLEGANSLLLSQPRRFAEFLGLFLLHGAEDRLMIASGCPLVHPRPLYEAILDFEMPADLQAGYGYPEVTMEMKRKFLGGNFMKLHGIDQAEYQARVANDYWGKRQAEEGVDGEMWSHYRARQDAAAGVPA